MVHHKAALTFAVLSVFIALQSTSALPFFRKRFVPPRVNLHIHPPVSGADLALASGGMLFSPGVIYSDVDNLVVGGGLPFNGGVINYDRPDFPDINYIGRPAYDFY